MFVTGLPTRQADAMRRSSSMCSGESSLQTVGGGGRVNHGGNKRDGECVCLCEHVSVSACVCEHPPAPPP